MWRQLKYCYWRDWTFVLVCLAVAEFFSITVVGCGECKGVELLFFGGYWFGEIPVMIENIFILLLLTFFCNLKVDFLLCHQREIIALPSPVSIPAG